MKKKQKKIQIILISIGLFLIITTYFYYPYINKVKFIENQSVQKDSDNVSDNDQTTFFENIEYQGLYDLNKPFTVKSEKARVLNEEPDILYMTKMRIIMHLSDGRIVNIISNKGKYNKTTYDCFFEDEVIATDGEVKIFAQNLDLLATKNFVEIYNEVSLNYPTGSLQADKIDYDFETKYFSVKMFSDDKRVKMKIIK